VVVKVELILLAKDREHQVVPVVVVLVRKPLGLVSLEFRTLVVAVAVVVKITPQTVAAQAVPVL